MGIAYQQMFDINDAMRCFQASLKLNPKNADVLNNIGTIYVSLKDFRSADKSYRKALKLDPRSAVILKNYGTELMLRRKYKQGDRMYAKAASIDPTIFQGSSGFSVADPTSTRDRGAMNYYMAKTCARAGLKGVAIGYLRKALSEGYVDRQRIMADNEFANLRGMPDFERLLTEQKRP
jgi:Tfp pilus assembly protein PilF